jgi:hypothetical protein
LKFLHKLSVVSICVFLKTVLRIFLSFILDIGMLIKLNEAEKIIDKYAL